MPGKHPLSLRRLETERQRLRSPRTDKEASILAAASRLFGDLGYRGATTARIAAEAGVTERTLFRYFPSKDDLYRRVMFPALLDSLVPPEMDRLAEVLGRGDLAFRDWYTQLLETRLQAASRNVPLVRTLMVELLQNDELRAGFGRLWRARAWETMVQALEAYRARGEIRGDIDIPAAARAIFSLNIGYFLARHVFAADGDWDDAAETGHLADLIWSGLRPPSRP